jgi:hypothetical protein
LSKAEWMPAPPISHSDRERLGVGFRAERGAGEAALQQ